MKTRRSLRWRFQLWYGALLAAVLAGFGLASYYFERAERLRAVDEALQVRLPVLTTAMTPGRPGVSPDSPGSSRRALNLRREDERLFGRDAPGDFYYCVWLRNGPPFTRSSNAPEEVPLPTVSRGLLRQRGDLREAYVFTAPGDCVLVGHATGPELAELHRLGWGLALSGAVVLALGLLGGWWIAGRTLRPIGEMSAVAREIAEGDLSRRVPADRSGNELAGLAEVLNSTFDRLEAAFARQARFTADAAHELRTPVTVLLTQVQTTLARARSAPEYQEALAACERAARRMRRLVESLLELARIDAAGDSQRVIFDLGQTAVECAALVRPMAEEREITLRCEAEEAHAFGDPEQIGQAITNLLSNAIQYNRSGGFVRVSVTAKETAAQLRVEDDGAGIAQADLPHIFERFYRAEKARSDGHAGLGLSLVNAIVQAHGGSIHVASAPGQGSTFTVRLPRAEG